MEGYRVTGHGRTTDTTDYAVWAAAGAVGGRPGPAQRLDRGVPSDPLPALATSASGCAEAVASIRDGQARVAVRPPGGSFRRPGRDRIERRLRAGRGGDRRRRHRDGALE